jgi:hypothetical protein
MRALPIVLLLALFAHPVAALAPEEREALASALRVLRMGWDDEAGRIAIEVLENGDPRPPGFAAFFGGFFSESPLTTELSRFLGDRALHGGPPEQRRLLQEALAEVVAREIEAVLRSELPDRFGPDFASDSTRFDHLRASMALLGRLAFEGELSRESRMALYDRLRGVIASYPRLLRKEFRVDGAAHPRLAAIRAHLYKNLQDLLVPFDPERFVADTGFRGDYAELVRNHGVLVLDNNGLDARQLRAIREVLALIPPELHRTRHISVNELLGNWEGHVVVPLMGSLGVNLFNISVDSHLDNQFPADFEPAAVPGFCAVLQHELNHTVDAFVVSGTPPRSLRRDQLIARAGSDTQQYLRSMLEPGYFVTHPQEFFASIANAYFSDSFHLLTLALKRFESGYREPLNQFLFFADVYSRGRDAVPFFVQDAECEFALHLIPIGRDARGRIERMELPDSKLRFALDEEGYVLHQSSEGASSASSSPRRASASSWPSGSGSIGMDRRSTRVRVVRAKGEPSWSSASALRSVSSNTPPTPR